MRSGNLKALYLKIKAQINKRALDFGKIHGFCYMIKISKVSNISCATRKKLLESGARRVKASTVTPSFFKQIFNVL